MLRGLVASKKDEAAVLLKITSNRQLHVWIDKCHHRAHMGYGSSDVGQEVGEMGAGGSERIPWGRGVSSGKLATSAS